MNLLLIDNRINDINTVIESIIDDTKYIIIDYDNDTFELIKNKITSLNTTFNNIGIFQENYNTDTYKFINSFQESILTNVESVDPDLNSWNDFYNLLEYFKNDLDITKLDLMGCNINKDTNWNYVINKFEK